MTTLEDRPRTGESSVGGGLAGILGIAIPVVGVVVLPIWDFPATGSTGEQIRDFVMRDRVALQSMMATYTVGITLWLVFGAAVWVRLRRAAAPGSSLPTMFGAGTVAYTTLLLAGFTAFDLLVRRPPGPEGAAMYYDLTFGLLAMSGLPTAVALGAYAAAVYRTRELPRPTAHLAVLAAAAHVSLLLSFVVPTGFFSLQGLVIAVIPAPLWAWTLATGMALTARPAT
jgi:hypothetical protein